MMQACWLNVLRVQRLTEFHVLRGALRQQLMQSDALHCCRCCGSVTDCVLLLHALHTRGEGVFLGVVEHVFLCCRTAILLIRGLVLASHQHQPCPHQPQAGTQVFQAVLKYTDLGLPAQGAAV